MNINKIKWLTQSTWLNNLYSKWNYIQYNENWEINTEITKTLTKIKQILDIDFEWKWLDNYNNIKLKNAINIFWHKNFPDLSSSYSLWEDYNLSAPKQDLHELSKEDNIKITNITIDYKRKFLRFYIWWSEIFIKNKAFDDLMKNF